MIDLLAGGLPLPFTPLVWVWGVRLEMEDEEVWCRTARPRTRAHTCGNTSGASILCENSLPLCPSGGDDVSAGGTFSDKSFEDAGTGVGELVL